MNIISTRQYSFLPILFAALVLSSCAAQKQSSFVKTAQTGGVAHVESKAKMIAKEGAELLSAGDFKAASALFNQALKQDITSSPLQLLNGLAYHLQALEGDVTQFALAEQGYELSVQYDASNWLGYYYLGLARMDQRDFLGAQEHFSKAIIYQPNDAELLYSMTVSSYYANDPTTALATGNKLLELEPNEPRSLQAMAMINASLGEDKEAQEYLKEFTSITGDDDKSKLISNRLTTWSKVYDRHAASSKKHEQQASKSVAKSTSEKPVSAEAQDLIIDKPSWLTPTAEVEFNDEKESIDKHPMVIVDVVIIRTEEDSSTSKGVNLMNGLSLQFGQADLSSAGLAFVRSTTNTGNNSDSSSVTGTNTAAAYTGNSETNNTITRAINFPSLTYSLNIANANSYSSEILARPTLVAINGETSDFFSGVEIQAAAIGGNGMDGSVVEILKEIGVKLEVTPEFLEDGRIKLNVKAERTFLTTPNTSSVTFSLRIDTSKTLVNANVAMNFGETLILSGLSEKETGNTRDGVPILQDIPILQYFFSKQSTREFQKSVLILMTPRLPSYTYQSEETKSRYNNRERALNELEARYSDWFKPYPNWASVFSHMQNNSLYREFRTGDVTMETWANAATVKSRVAQALDFLYY
jgi:tetratricopeptide (TPR) repeat protein